MQAETQLPGGQQIIATLQGGDTQRLSGGIDLECAEHQQRQQAADPLAEYGIG